MKSFSAIAGTLLLASALSHADTHEVPNNSVPSEENPASTIEMTKARMGAVLVDSRLPPNVVPTEKNADYPWKSSVRSDLTPNSQFVIGNSNGLRLGVEFHLSTTSPQSSNHYDSKLGVGVTNEGFGIKYTAKF